MNKSVRTYYDEFLHKRMVLYRLYGNKRLDAAFQTIKNYLSPNSLVADVGCGIGIISEKIARRDKSTRVVGVDISSKNIEYAKRTISLPNICFFDSDVSTQIDRLRENSPDGFDLLVLVDVIEHIPAADRQTLLQNLTNLAKPNGTLFMSYPSPEYQQYLMKNDPEELQIIDNVVRTVDIVREATESGWVLHSFKYVDIWRKNQYIHAVFVRTLQESQPRVPTRFLPHLLSRMYQRLSQPVRKLKYVRRPFRNWPTEIE